VGLCYDCHLPSEGGKGFFAESNCFVYEDFTSTKSTTYLIRWLGLYRNFNDDSYTWTDGTPIDYLNWDEGEPTKGNGYRKVGLPMYFIKIFGAICATLQCAT